jgi:hypothetical protein
MSRDTNRNALRSGLPWAYLGFVVLVASIGLWLFDAGALLKALHPGTVSALLGVLGSVLFGVGLWAFARGRIARRTSPWLWVALFLWAGELVLRLRALLVGTGAADSGTAGAARASFDGLRLLLVGGAMVALANGVLWLWRDRASDGVRLTWGATRVFFLLQVALVGLAAAAPSAQLEEHLGQRVWLVLAWIAFAAPWIALYAALRRTMRELGRQETPTEFLKPTA